MDENKENVATGAEEDTETGKTTYTKEEVDAMLQSYADKRVAQALATQERKNQAKIKEAEKLAKMSEQEKFVYELEQREKAIAEKEHELAMAENRAEASKILADKGLDLSLVDFVVRDTAEEMNNSINLLDKAFKKSVKLEVEKRLAGNTPKRGLLVDKSISKEDFLKMSYSELMELKENSPELYAQLSK